MHYGKVTRRVRYSPLVPMERRGRESHPLPLGAYGAGGRVHLLSAQRPRHVAASGLPRCPSQPIEARAAFVAARGLPRSLVARTVAHGRDLHVVDRYCVRTATIASAAIRLLVA